MTKKIYIKKEQSKETKRYTKVERYCLQCGINISHRTKDVKFCCPACKALYKQNNDYVKDAKPEKPKLKLPPIDPDVLPYESYQIEPSPSSIAQSRLTKEMPEQLYVSTPHSSEPMSQIQKFYQRYSQNKGNSNGNS